MEIFFRKRSFFTVAFVGLVLSLASLPLIFAFEAHVINVTATIEPNQCEAKSKGFWANNEGCSQGTGESPWSQDINELSSGYSDYFGTETGSQICAGLWIPNCPAGNTVEAKLCKAKAQALALELNIVSNHLALGALLAGADDGNGAFETLHLNSNSSIKDAIVAIESILASQFPSKSDLTDTAYVADRIISFYENENPLAPQCIFNPHDIPSCKDGNSHHDEDAHDGDDHNKGDKDENHGGEASLNSSYENHELGDGDNDNNHDDNQCKEDDHDENENNDHGNNDKDKKDEHDSPSADNASNVSKPPHDEIQNQNQNELNNRIDNLDIPDAVNIPIIENPTSPDLNSNTSINVESTEPEPSASVATENN